MHDIIIIGGGTAGLTASIYAARAGKTALVLEALSLGGQIAYSPKVENYPAIKSISGAEFTVALTEQSTELGVEIEFENTLEIREDNGFTVITEDGEYSGKAVIIATGVKNRRLGLPGEDELVGKGVSYCAVCDGAFYKGRTAAVVGGGDTALTDALYLSSYCKKVYLIHRRDKFRGEDKLAALLETKDNVELVLNSVVEEFLSAENLEGLKVRNTSTGETSVISTDGVFIAIGQEPQNGAFRDVVSLDEYGYIIAGEDCKTSHKGIFAAGDCRTKSVRQLTTAAADGAIAGLAACDYIGY